MANEIEYSRSCPRCGKLQKYNNKANLVRAMKSNSICHSCRMRQRIYSNETRTKMSSSAKLRVIGGFQGKRHTEESKRKMKEHYPDVSGQNNPFYGRHHSDTSKQKMMGRHHKHSVETKEKMSAIVKKRYESLLARKKMSLSVKLAMHRPEVRKKHIEALSHSRWLKVRTDKGQVELIEKWNKLGFRFIPNYQLHTDDFLCYIDGYDPEHNVVLEFDSQYHRKLSQQKKDVEREKKIINILNPKKFWRYNSHIYSFTQTIGG